MSGEYPGTWGRSLAGEARGVVGRKSRLGQETCRGYRIVRMSFPGHVPAVMKCVGMDSDAWVTVRHRHGLQRKGWMVYVIRCAR